MREDKIHDAIGELPEDLLMPVEKLRQKKRYPIIKWAALAACLCLLLSLPLGTGMMGATKAESLNEAPMENKVQEDSLGMVADDAGVSAFRGKVLEVHEQCVLVEPLEGEAERNSCSKIYVSFGKLEKTPEIAVGDILVITYDGMIQETYPAQINSVYSVEVIE